MAARLHTSQAKLARLTREVERWGVCVEVRLEAYRATPSSKNLRTLTQALRVLRCKTIDLNWAAAQIDQILNQVRKR